MVKTIVIIIKLNINTIYFYYIKLYIQYICYKIVIIIIINHTKLIAIVFWIWHISSRWIGRRSMSSILDCVVDRHSHGLSSILECVVDRHADAVSSILGCDEANSMHLRASADLGHLIHVDAVVRVETRMMESDVALAID